MSQQFNSQLLRQTNSIERQQQYVHCVSKNGGHDYMIYVNFWLVFIVVGKLPQQLEKVERNLHRLRSIARRLISFLRCSE